MEGIVTITPHENARVVVDGQPIRETYMLENSACIVLGQDTTLIFVDELSQDGADGLGQGISPEVMKRKVRVGTVSNCKRNKIFAIDRSR